MPEDREAFGEGGHRSPGNELSPCTSGTDWPWEAGHATAS